MFIDNFDHSIIRKYIAYFGALFNNVNIDRKLSDGEVAARFRVPLHFAKMEHALQRVTEDPGDTNKEAIVLPAMSFDLVDFKYAPGRKQPTKARQAVQLSGDPNNFGVMHAPVPYDFHFQLSVLVKNVNDGLKIVQQVAPYFSPDYTATLELIPEMGIQMETPLVLQSTAMDYDVPQDYKTRVTYMHVLDFILQGVLFGPEKKWPVIKFANVDYFIESGDASVPNGIFWTSVTTPGLTANGQPTTDPTQAVDPLTVYVSDNFDYIVQSNTTIPSGER